MKNIKAKALTLLGVALPVLSKAEEFEYDYGNYDYDTVDATAGLALAGGMLLFAIVMGLVGLVVFILWVMMFIDCIKRDFEQKTLYIILMLLLGWVGALVYYFAIKRKNVGSTGGNKPQASTPPPAQPQQ